MIKSVEEPQISFPIFPTHDKRTHDDALDLRACRKRLAAVDCDRIGQLRAARDAERLMRAADAALYAAKSAGRNQVKVV